MLKGLKVQLREAESSDRRRVYKWLAQSDLTPSIMGLPRFPDHPIPTWEEFCNDYQPHYFDGSHVQRGRCFIIVADQTDVGVICYNDLRNDKSIDVDIWLRSESDCGKGFGPDALETLADYLHREYSVNRIVVSPSARNHRAITAYKKAGFRMAPKEQYHMLVKTGEMEYEDNIILVKEYAHNNVFNPDAQKPRTG